MSKPHEAKNLTGPVRLCLTGSHTRVPLTREASGRTPVLDLPSNSGKILVFQATLRSSFVALRCPPPEGRLTRILLGDTTVEVAAGKSSARLSAGYASE